jgi:16S rRNA (guanine527-N7)-methyltransferase
MKKNAVNKSAKKSKKAGFKKPTQGSAQKMRSGSSQSASKKAPPLRYEPEPQNELIKKVTSRDNKKLNRTHKIKPAEYTLEQIEERLFDVFFNHGFKSFDHEKRKQLAKFCSLLLEEQKTLNLTRLVKVHEIGLKHFIDSLMLAEKHTLKFPLMDVGSGAGFPGIPLAILFPDEKIILIEEDKPKAKYLERMQKKLGLQNVEVYHKKFDEHYTIPAQNIVVRTLPMSMEYLLKFSSQVLARKGQIIVMKNPASEFENPKEQAMTLGFKLKPVIKYNLPDSPHERSLVIYEKL